MEWALILILILLGASRSSSTTEGKNDDERARYAALRSRAATGASWIPFFAEALIRAGVPSFMAAGPAAALARWAGIESGGNPADQTGGANERGLLQYDHETFLKAGLTEEQWDSIASPIVSHAEQADMAVKYLKYVGTVVRKATGWPISAIADIAWAAYLYHELPLIVSEMETQGAFKSGRAATAAAWRATALDGAPGGYAASPEAFKYGHPPTPAGLYLRFGIGANVVADG